MKIRIHPIAPALAPSAPAVAETKLADVGLQAAPPAPRVGFEADAGVLDLLPVERERPDLPRLLVRVTVEVLLRTGLRVRPAAA